MFAASLAMPAPGLSGGLSARRARPLCPRSRRIAVSQQTTFRAKVQNALQQERVYSSIWSACTLGDPDGLSPAARGVSQRRHTGAGAVWQARWNVTMDRR